jgi:hypothetical protein
MNISWLLLPLAAVAGVILATVNIDFVFNSGHVDYCDATHVKYLSELARNM